MENPLNYELTENQIKLVCSILNKIIDKNESFKNQGLTSQTAGFAYDDSGRFLSQTGDDLEPPDESLEWLLTEGV